MEVKIGYKQTEIGIIPEDWKVIELSNIGMLVTGNTPPTKDRSNYGYQYLFVSPSDLGNNKRIISSEKRISEKGRRLSRLLPMESILFVCIGSTIGKIGIAGAELSTNQQITSILVDDSFYSPNFVYYSLDFISPRIKLSAGRQAVPIVNKTEFGTTLLGVPLAKSEQEAIAKALSDVDALIESLDQLIAKKRDIKQGTMQELLTGKKRLAGFNEEWVVRRMNECVTLGRKRIDPRKSEKHEFCVELEHIGQGTGVLVGSKSTSTESSLKSVFNEGDVLFGKLRAYLRKYWLADRSGVCSTEVWVLSPIINVVMSAFLFQIVQTDNFIEAASSSYGTHMPRSDWNMVKNYELTIPTTIKEQTAIATVLTDIDAEITVLEAKLSKIRMLKQGMMYNLLTGRIRLV